LTVEPGQDLYFYPLTSLGAGGLDEKFVKLGLEDRTHIVGVFAISRNLGMIIADVLGQRC
jgi:hypothetical protein